MPADVPADDKRISVAQRALACVRTRWHASRVRLSRRCEHASLKCGQTGLSVPSAAHRESRLSRWQREAVDRNSLATPAECHWGLEDTPHRGRQHIQRCRRQCVSWPTTPACLVKMLPESPAPPICKSTGRLVRCAPPIFIGRLLAASVRELTPQRAPQPECAAHLKRECCDFERNINRSYDIHNHGFKEIYKWRIWFDKTTQVARFKSMVRICPMALVGFKPFGHTLTQF